MSNALYFVLCGVLAAALIGLGLAAPQGLGARSPGPFGHPLAPLRVAPKAPVGAPALRGAGAPR